MVASSKRLQCITTLAAHQAARRPPKRRLVSSTKAPVVGLGFIEYRSRSPLYTSVTVKLPSTVVITIEAQILINPIRLGTRLGATGEVSRRSSSLLQAGLNVIVLRMPLTPERSVCR